MNIKSRLSGSLFALALAICATVAPSYGGTVDVWFSGGTGGEIQVNGSGAGSSLVASTFSVPFTSLFIYGAATTADNGTWTLTSTNLTLSVSGGVDTLTLTGTVGSCAGCIGTSNLGGFTGTLETITYSPVLAYTSTNPPTTHGYYVNGVNTSMILDYAAPTSITDYLLSDLGEVGATTTVASTGNSTNETGPGTLSGGDYTFTPSSSVLDLTVTQTPEPASFLLLGLGLVGIAWFSRRRSTRT